MWPFKKASKHSNNFTYSQIDITENFGDNLNLKSDEWIKTIPINTQINNPESMGLPPVGSSIEKVYDIASRLSTLRDQINNPEDGVYCPICHIANIELNKLQSPCPQCGRKLLKFGWN